MDFGFPKDTESLLVLRNHCYIATNKGGKSTMNTKKSIILQWVVARQTGQPYL
jgi:hypothetical protein